MEYYFTLANTAAEKQNYYFTSFGQLTNIRPKVIMWVKGNLFMENGNYEDLRQPNEAQNSTIFDDVFRTIAQKMPYRRAFIPYRVPVWEGWQHGSQDDRV